MMEALIRLLNDKSNPVLQFFKYMICGGCAFVVDFVIFYFCIWLIFPALTESDPFTSVLHALNMEITPVTEAVRLRHFWMSKVICFIFSNLTAYLLNIRFVFESGRHKRHHELFLFYAISTVSFVVGTWLGAVLIGTFGLDTTYSYAGAVVSALLINFAGRKYLIFKG